MKHSRSFTQVLDLLRPYRWELFLGTLLTFLPAYFSVWNPYLIGKLIDDGILGNHFESVLLFGGLTFFSFSARAFSKTLVNYCMSRFGLQILVDYRDFLLKRILNYPIRFFDRTPSGRLATRLTSDISSLQELFSTALVPLVGSLVLLVGVSVAMFLLNWKLALVSLSVFPLLVLVTVYFHDKIRRRFGIMRRSLSALNSLATESFSGNRDLKVFSALEMNQAEFERASLKFQNRNLEAIREYAFYNPIVPFITAQMEIGILIYGSFEILHQRMSVGELVAFLGYAAQFSWPIRDFAEKYAVLQQALASVDRLLEISDVDPEQDQGSVAFSPGAITFKDVQFSYEPGSAPAVSDLNFTASQGDKIALLGETGSGKTTTCSLLMRFYKPDQGDIFVGDRSIEDYSIDSFRRQIGWVSQDVVLFSQTLRENLRFYQDGITDQDLWKVLDIVQLKDWAEDLPGGLDEPLSERASAFSSGQRQLLSLARALVHQPKILVFDEATSYIDSQTEWRLQNAIERLWQLPEFEGMTGFFIAHRLSTLRKCDRMLVFKGGRILEMGTYDELLRLDGYAAKLYKEQFKKSA